MPSVRSQPLLCVRDVKASSRWYQTVLGVKSGHGGDEYEMLMDGQVMVMQLHCFEQDHHHGSMGDPSKPLGNGVAVWFHVDDLDGVVARSKAAGATVQTEVHVNPNAQQRELWLRDPDGYLVVVAGQ
jgi:catechol 2,3-dioxygenase-like lactoylglutathione lyase family enzyme